MSRVRRAGALGRVARRDRQEGHARREHRHRRVGPRPGDDLRSAQAVRGCRHRGAVRLEHRPDRPRAEDRGPRPRDDAVHRRLEDLHDARDAHQRAAGARLAVGGARGVGRDRRLDEAQDRCRRPPLRRRLDRARQGRRVRHRPRERVRILGLGRRPLLGRLGDRPVARDRARPRRVPRAARRLPRRRRARAHDAARVERAGADGPAQRLVRRTSSARSRTRCSPTRSSCTASPRTCSSSRWNRTASRCAGTAPPSRPTPARCSGASPARTASTRSTS